MLSCWRLACALALTLAFASLALAEDDAADPHHPHHVSVFLGGSAGHHEGFSGGVEYSYRVNRWFSLGPSIEVTDTSGEPTLLIAVFNLHPWRDLKLIFGPGVEWVNGEENAALGGLVGFHFAGRYSVAPVYHADWADWADDEWTHTIGVDFGIGF